MCTTRKIMATYCFHYNIEGKHYLLSTERYRPAMLPGIHVFIILHEVSHCFASGLVVVLCKILMVNGLLLTARCYILCYESWVTTVLYLNNNWVGCVFSILYRYDCIYPFINYYFINCHRTSITHYISVIRPSGSTWHNADITIKDVNNDVYYCIDDDVWGCYVC